MHSSAEIRGVVRLRDAGRSLAEVEAETGINRYTVLRWYRDDIFVVLARRRVRELLQHGGMGSGAHAGEPSESCGQQHAGALAEAYSYLLGQYLGDGHITLMPRGVISLWKHWPCLIPQHGPGRNHKRKIELLPWQENLVSEHPKPFLRGLMHSDGCWHINTVAGHDYSRYQFTNRSADIHGLLRHSLDQLGVHWTDARGRATYVSRRADVAFLDTFIGPKS